MPAPYWTTYPEAIYLAGGVHRARCWRAPDAGYKVTVEQLEARAAPNETKVLLMVSPSNPTGAVYTARRDHRDRALGRRRRALGHHRRDLRAPGLRRRTVQLGAGAGARARRPLRRRQRRREDLRDDRLAGRVADRPEATSSARRRTCSRTRRPTSSNVAQAAALAAVSGDLTAVHEMRHRLRPAPARRCTRACPRSPGSPARCREGAFYASPTSSATAEQADRAVARRPAPSSSRRWCSRRSAWRWCPVRPSAPRALPPVVRARRRRPRRGRRPPVVPAAEIS